MTATWGPPANKTELVKVLRAHTTAFSQFGYRPTEIRLNEPMRRLWVSGTRVSRITGPTGLGINVNTGFKFYDTVLWDYIEYIAIRPGTNRSRRTSTFLTPPTLTLAEAVAYYQLRHRRTDPQTAYDAAAPLAALAAPGSGSGAGPVMDLAAAVDMFNGIYEGFDTAAEAVTHIERLAY